MNVVKLVCYAHTKGEGLQDLFVVVELQESDLETIQERYEKSQEDRKKDPFLSETIYWTGTAFLVQAIGDDDLEDQVMCWGRSWNLQPGGWQPRAEDVRKTTLCSAHFGVSGMWWEMNEKHIQAKYHTPRLSMEDLGSFVREAKGEKK
jgi:hypothetical protein